MDEIGAKDGDILLETRQNRLTDTKCLDGFLIRAGKEMFVMRGREAENIAQDLGKSEIHLGNPFHKTLGSRQM